MNLTDESVGLAAQAFNRAAIGEVGWDQPLNSMVDLLEMRSGQLVAFGRNSLIPLNMMTRMVDEASSEFVQINGGDPSVNSKVRVGLTLPELTVLDEADYDTPGDRIRHPEFGAWMDRHNIGYCCVSTLIRTPDTLVGLASLQSSFGPGLDETGKRAFGAIAAAARQAVILCEAIEEHGVRLLGPALEAARLCALVVDYSGKVRTMTPSAEKIVSEQRFGRIHDGRFVPHRPDERKRFEAELGFAIQAWAIPKPAGSMPSVLTAHDGERLVTEFLPMPTEHSFKFSAAALVLFKPRGDVARRRATVAAALFGLTHAETKVTQAMLNGLSPHEIAISTGISVGTVRNHIHRTLAKADCRSQSAFIALLAMHD